MACELPSWLDEALLTVALQGGECEDPAVRVYVTKFSAISAVTADNKRFSRVYRVHVDYQFQGRAGSTSLIIKAPFEKGLVYEYAIHFGLYAKEPIMYQELLPRINYLLGCDVGPIALYCAVPRVLVLSDLKKHGYVMCDRFTQLNFLHCEQVFKKLAKFHAASVACKRDRPDLIQTVGKESFFIESDFFNTIIKRKIETSITIVSGLINESGVNREVAETLERSAATVVDSLLRWCAPKKSGLNVLNHGDLWSNTVVFKHSVSGTVVDVKFIDFQVPKYVSPVIDILFFIWSSADRNVRESRISELCEIYRQELNFTLGRLNCEERLTEEELHGDLRNSLDLGIFVVTNILPIIFREPEDVVDPESFNLDLELMLKHINLEKILSGRRYRESVPVVVKQMLAWISTL